VTNCWFSSERRALGGDAHQPVDAVVRKGVGLPTDLDQHRPQHGEGDRQLQVEAGPLAEARADADGATHAADRILDHVEPHPPAGELRDRGGHREPGQEEEFEQLGLRHRLEQVGRGQAALEDPAPQPVQVNAAAVVGNRDGQHAGPVLHLDADQPRLRFAGRPPPGRGLDAVIDGVLQQVRQRGLQLLEDVPIDLRGLADDFQADRLAEAARQLPHHARKVLGAVRERPHAADNDLVIQARIEVFGLRDVVLELADSLHQDLLARSGLPAGLGDQVRELVGAAGRQGLGLVIKQARQVVLLFLELEQGAGERLKPAGLNKRFAGQAHESRETLGRDTDHRLGGLIRDRRRRDRSGRRRRSHLDGARGQHGWRRRCRVDRRGKFSRGEDRGRFGGRPGRQRGRRPPALKQRPQLLSQVADFGRLVDGPVGQRVVGELAHLGQNGGAPEDQRGLGALATKPAVPHRREHLFQVLGEVRRRDEADDPGRAPDRVGGLHQRLDALRIGPTFFQRLGPLVQGGRQFPDLLPKERQHVRIGPGVPGSGRLPSVGRGRGWGFAPGKRQLTTVRVVGLGQRPELFLDLGDLPLVARAPRSIRDLLDLTQPRQQIGAAEQDVQVRRPQAHPAVLSGHQRVFHGVGQLHGEVYADDAGGTLDRVGRPHERLDRRRLGGSALPLQQAPAEGGGVDAHLFPEQVHHRARTAVVHRILVRKASNRRISSR
jgi:hypothetical protein